ncbi:Protein phosphatase 1 regulatory subunit and related proteins protein [Dioscorea alata]|uniref:Protein phosphatase 1 regulatory subunit and related proteins protein n=1 Tax=Dioscorea alata TaxID=55571 RepID=A0ACB7WRF1_DIOAL|nr:Protein phosphatase 1 regulatory subunit and related proteins protein [Dioscorea alata]
MVMKKITKALLPLLLSFIYFKLCLCNGDSTFGCREGEKKVLLDFKDGITDPGELLSSWIDEDCCIWYGVQCDNQTGHVIKLDLRNTGSDEVLLSEQALGGEISFSLIGLKHLRYLDLSMNNFLGIRIPTFFGSLGSLRYLNLSNAGFLGPVPHQLGNLSHLHYLDLSDTFVWTSETMFLVGSHWLANLSSLQYLNLDNLNLSRAPNLLKTLNTLPMLSELHLSDCYLHVPHSLSYVNFPYLRILDLSSNNVSSIVPLWLFNLTNLEYLDLSYNLFQGLVPSDVGKLTSLKVLNLTNNGVLEGVPATLGKLCMLERLDLSWNNFNGELIELEEAFSGCIQKSLKILQWTNSGLTSHLPSWFGNLKSLQRLDLSSNSLYGSLPQFQLPSLQELYISANKLNGTIPAHLGKLFPELVVFDLSSNNLVGVLTEAHFNNLSKLEYLYLSTNSFKLVVSSTWIPPLRLKEVHMRDMELGPRFPTWIQKLENITSIDMSNAEIADILPNWFWYFSPNMRHINLSHNNLTGQIPSSFKLLKLDFLDLSYNHLDGALP